MLEPVMTMREGARIYAPGGTLLEPGDRARAAGPRRGARVARRRGRRGRVHGHDRRRRCSTLSRRARRAADRATTSPRYAARAGASRSRRRGSACASSRRGGLSGVPETLARLPRSRGSHRADRLVALVGALDGARGPGDAHDEPRRRRRRRQRLRADDEPRPRLRATGCPGLDLHLNSMLGEADLLHGPLVPGARMQSMMAPTLVLDGDGLALAIGAAGGTRLRTALVTVAAGDPRRGARPAGGGRRGRASIPPATSSTPSRAPTRTGSPRSRRAGRTVRRWPERHHYFGGVSAIGASGAAADPRRSGAALAAPAAG